jgi:hypothetical protein
MCLEQTHVSRDPFVYSKPMDLEQSHVSRTGQCQESSSICLEQANVQRAGECA